MLWCLGIQKFNFFLAHVCDNVLKVNNSTFVFCDLSYFKFLEMKTIKIILAALMIFLFKISSAQILFQKTFGGPGGEWASSIQQMTDGGYIIGGVTNSYGGGGMDFYLIRT